MHDINWIRNTPEAFKVAMLKRDIKVDINKILEIDSRRRRAIADIQELQQQKNLLAAEIAKFKDKKLPEFQQLLKKANEVKTKLQQSPKTSELDSELNNLLAEFPNLLDEDVNEGKDETENKLIKIWGEIPKFNFKPKQHFELGEDLAQMDFETATKMSGSRFVLLKKDLAKLERALAHFMLETHSEKFGYEEISPPLMVKDEAMYGVGQLPKFEEDSFSTTNNYRLIPTAEVTLTNIVANKILKEEELPLRYTAYTPCFRSEAGSAGKDTRGMIRLHQFSKVELVSITTNKQSKAEHERMTECAEYILQQLELPYRIMSLCSGDIGFCANKTYDLEVWMPGQNCYREISSCSNCGDFQARRMQAKYRDADKEINFVHTLNGSALAVGRTMVAILENYQQENGDILIPKVLQSYMRKNIINRN
jgi:seryl-tRNA synthetase